MEQPSQGGGARPAEPGGADGGLRIDLGRGLPAAGGGLAAYAAEHPGAGRHGAMALLTRPGAPPRVRPMTVLPGMTLPALLTTHRLTVAPGPQGVGEVFVLCDAPPGPPVGGRQAIARRWGEPELVACVMRPIAALLVGLQRLRLTHRAIRPDNVFQALPGQPVVAGIGWAAPPAALQDAAFESADMAACLPSGCGDGTLADDVYALGVLMLALAAGQVPMTGLDAAEIVRRKRAMGSHAALVADLRVPQGVAELVRGMLADDPEHRPAPAQLQIAEAVRGRRLALRPARVAQRPIEIAGRTAWHARALAGTLAAAPEAGMQALRAGTVERWVRRELAESALAVQIEALYRTRASDPAPGDADAAAGMDGAESRDALRLTRAIALLDPLAPLCWRGIALWPDGLGPALAAADPERRAELGRMIEAEALTAWAEARPTRCDVAMLRAQARDWRMLVGMRDSALGLGVLSAQLNPLERCPSPALAATPVVRATDLLPALEQLAGQGLARPALPIDQPLAAYLAGHDDLRAGREALALPHASGPPAAHAQLRLLARLQVRLRAPPLPALAQWLADGVGPLLAEWRGRARRDRLGAALRRHAEAGLLAPLLDALEDEAERAADTAEAAAAAEAIARIDAELARLAEGRPRRAAEAARAGIAISTALAVMAVAIVAALISG